MKTGVPGDGRFELRRRLGEGGMGIVYEALDRHHGRIVALKILRSLDGDGLFRFKNEFRAACELRHPNLVRLEELFCEDGQWFFTMELVEGTSLLAYVRGPAPAAHPHAARRTSLDTLSTAEIDKRDALRTAPSDDYLARLRDVLAQLSSGLLALHDAGKVHRDVKPSNVLVTADRRAVLLDFGLVTAASAVVRDTSVHAIGTAAYMAPEQAAGEAVGPEADWYGMGTILYEALTGRLPFEGSPGDVLAAKQWIEPPPPRELVAGLPPELDALCCALLRRDPAQRPSGKEILARLDAATVPALRSGGAPRTAPFVGREHELDRIRRAYNSSRAGLGSQLLLVHGDSGLGKTALCERFFAGLKPEEPQLVVLRGRCFHRESVPYNAFDGVVDALCTQLFHMDPVHAAVLLPRDSPALARVFPILHRLRALAQIAPPSLQNPQELRARAFSALRDLLARLAESRPLIIFIDDLQWADADSCALLAELMQPPVPRLFVLATARTAEIIAEQSLHSCETLPLAGLSTEASVELARCWLDSDGSAATRVAADAGGHPLFVQELCRYVTSASARSEPGVALDDALWSRIEDLDPQMRHLLELVAIAGAPIAQEVLADAAGLDRAGCIERLATLEHVKLLRLSGLSASDTVEGYHDRISDTILDRVEPDARKAHHARLAAALELRSDTDARAIVSHLSCAGQTERAAEVAEHVARRSATALAFGDAAELYRVALRLGSFDDDRRSRVLLALAEALNYAGRGPEAAETYLDAAACTSLPEHSRLDCLRLAAEQFLVSGHIEQGLAILRQVLAEIGEPPPRTQLGSFARLAWRRIRVRLRGLRWTPRDSAEIPARELTRLEMHKAAAYGLAMIDPATAADYQSRALLLSLRIGDRRRVVRSLCSEASFLGAQGNHARAADVLQHARRIARDTSDAYLTGWLAGATGICAYFIGDLHTAYDALRTSQRTLREQTVGSSWELASVTLFLTFVLRMRGSLVELRSDYDQELRDARRRGDRYTETTLVRGCNFLWLAADDPDSARDELERSSWTPATNTIYLQHWFELRARTELDMYAGRVGPDPSALAKVERSQLGRVQSVRAEVRWLRGGLLLRRGGVALDALPGIARQLDSLPISYARVWSRLLCAGLAGRRGDPDRSERLLREAIGMAEHAQMMLTAMAARRHLGRLCGGDEGAALISRADSWMKNEQIVRPDRLANALVAGFEDPQLALSS